MRSLKGKTMLVLLFLCIAVGGASVFAQTDQHIYDNAGLLSESEKRELEALASKHSLEHDADFLFLTTESMGGQPIETYMGDFFDEWATEHGQEDAVLFTIDMGSREVYLAGFGTAETTLDAERIDMVLDRTVPYLTAGAYGAAFRETVETSSRYMEYRPGVNPENLFFKTWFQLAVALLVGGVIVGSMVYNAGGRVTTSSRTYFDENNSRVKNERDRFRNKTVSRRKIPKNNNSGGGFGGGSTGGGRSFSGGGRGF